MRRLHERLPLGRRDIGGRPGGRPYGERSAFVRDPTETTGNRDAARPAVGRPCAPHRHAVPARPRVERLHGLPRARVRRGRRERHEEPAGLIPYTRMRIGDAAIEFGPAPTDAWRLLPVCGGSGRGVRTGALRRRNLVIGAHRPAYRPDRVRRGPGGQSLVHRAPLRLALSARSGRPA